MHLSFQTDPAIIGIDLCSHMDPHYTEHEEMLLQAQAIL